jgi:hypothetical protein
MEYNSIIKAAACKIGDPIDMARGEIGPELYDDVAAGREGKSQAVAVGHEINSVIRSKGARFRLREVVAPELRRP